MGKPFHQIGIADERPAKGDQVCMTIPNRRFCRFLCVAAVPANQMDSTRHLRLHYYQFSLFLSSYGLEVTVAISDPNLQIKSGRKLSNVKAASRGSTTMPCLLATQKAIILLERKGDRFYSPLFIISNLNFSGSTGYRVSLNLLSLGKPMYGIFPHYHSSNHPFQSQIRP
jgi:hypothetical protein